MVRWHQTARRAVIAAAVAVLVLPSGARAQEDAGAGAPSFKEGDVISFDKLDSLKNFLPAEFWANRDFFFYEGMKMEIGPAFKEYTEPPEWLAASAQFKGQAKIGPDESLENYTTGWAFDPASIDCKGDPNAGVKHMWNFTYAWDGDGSDTHFFYSYWDRGEELPLYYEGTSKTIRLAHRAEPELIEKNQGDMFRGEKRSAAFGIEVDAPFDARGIMVMTYRYKDADKPVASAKNDDTWVYVPTLRRVRRISTAQRTDAVSGTDFTFDDLRSFAGIVPQYTWQCLGEMDILAPVNSKVKAYPYAKDHNFGPYGLSYADDRWELRHAVKVRMKPKNPEHPYHHKDIYIDAATYNPLYSFAYDQKEELWKIIWHNHRWSEDKTISKNGEDWYAGWTGIPKPNDLRTVSDTIVNVQTGTGNRIEFWDNTGRPYTNADGDIAQGKVRRYIDIGRLTKGR